MMRPGMQSRNSQHGAVAIIVALSLAVLIGFAGLVLDLGRLYVNKTELQNAADACALAAARELTCSVAPCPAGNLTSAQNAGIYTAGRSNRDLQASPVTIAPADVKFSTVFAPNSSYLSIAGGADPASKFVMCTANSTGLLPWFMGVMGLPAANAVSATAVATLGPGNTFCSTAPIGICQQGSPPNYGYTVGSWIASQFTSGNNGNDNLTGGFRWIDFTPNAGGNSEIRNQLATTESVCDLTIGSNVQQPGQQQGAKSAYNTRFGIYPNGANGYTPTTAPPDTTGYAYPNKAPGSPVIPIGTSAYSDYTSRRDGSHTPFTSNEYDASGAGGNISGTPITSAAHGANGQKGRRLVTVPMVDCTAGNVVPIVDMVCVLMLNPMSNGASGTIYVEFRGNASDPNTPCVTYGSVGGPTTSGPPVPKLVQ